MQRLGLILALALLMMSTPAQAADVVHVRLGSAIEALVAGPEGGAWVRIDRGQSAALGRASADGRFVSAAVDEFIDGGALGPDGQAWFRSGLHQFTRMDAGGRLTQVGPLPDGGAAVEDVFAAGADGTLWAATSQIESVAHVTPQGAAIYVRTALPACKERPLAIAMERASDGVMWIADPVCDRLLRVTPAGTTSVVALPDTSVDALAADASGGMWFAARNGAGHVDAAGTVTRLPLPSSHDQATDVTVTPDGVAWFALGRCVLGRAAPGGPLSQVRAPVPATLLAADPTGGLWLASPARLVHAAPADLGGACDDKAPAVRVTPGKRVTLTALRTGGLKITAREPAALSGIGFYEVAGENIGQGDGMVRIASGAKGGSARYRVQASVLRAFARALERGERVEISFFATATDREGNQRELQRTVQVTR